MREPTVSPRRDVTVTASVLAVLVGLATVNCGAKTACGSGQPTCLPPLLGHAAALVDERGGEVSVEGGPSVTIPAGALDRPTLIEIAELGPGSNGEPRQYAFAPDGQVFARPVDVAFPVPEGVLAAFVYWADRTGGFDPIGGSVADGTVRARVAHFSGGYVGLTKGTRTVTGSRITTNIRTAGITNEPVDLSPETVAAHVERSGGGYDTYQGVGRADGTFRIADVPVGAYLLQVGNRYLRTSEDVVDMGKVVPGRPGLKEADATQTLGVTLSLTNLAPWNEAATTSVADRIDVFSPDANDWFTAVSTPMVFGATTLQGGIDLRSGVTKIPVFALEASAGDELVVAQQSAHVSPNGIPYRATDRVFRSGPISLPAKPWPELRGAFDDVSSARTALLWFVEDFETALLADVHPAAVHLATDFTNRFRILGQAGGLAYGTHELTGKPEFLGVAAPPGTGKLDTGTMVFGTPSWGDWGAHYVATVDRYVPVDFGGTVQYFNATLRVMAPAHEGVTVISPELGLARSPTVNGKSLFVPQTDVGLTPTFSWEEPSPGPADAYMLQVIRLRSTGPMPRYDIAAFIDTTARSVTLPAGILRQGETYVAWIRSYKRNIRDAAPLRVFLPVSYSVQVTDTFTP